MVLRRGLFLEASLRLPGREGSPRSSESITWGSSSSEISFFWAFVAESFFGPISASGWIYINFLFDDRLPRNEERSASLEGEAGLGCKFDMRISLVNLICTRPVMYSWIWFS